MSTIYSQILRYMDIVPVDKTSLATYEDQYHWLLRLQSIGPYVHSDTMSNYKAVYMLLVATGLDPDRALVLACREGLRGVALYLSDYASNNAHARCVSHTPDLEIVKSVPIVREHVLDVLRSRSSDREAVEALLSVVTLPIEGDYSSILTSPSSDLVASKVDDSIIPRIAEQADAKASVVLDQRGYVYPIVRAITQDLEHSVLVWLSRGQAQHAIRDSLTTAIRHDSRVGAILLDSLQDTSSHLVQFAVRCNNYWVLSKLPYGGHDLSLAIALGNKRSVEAMARIATRQHLRQCITLRRNGEAGIIRPYV